MHTSFLIRYFDIEAWHRDLFLALLEFKSPWTWQEMSDAFMQVCCHLRAPPGSASKCSDWINHLHRIDWCRIECETGATDASKILIHHHAPSLPRKKPRCRRALLRAVRWSMEHQQIENEWGAKVSKASKEYQDYFNLDDGDLKKRMKLLAAWEQCIKQRDSALKAHRSKFRLNGE